MEIKINEIAMRMKELREICEFTPEEMAKACDVSVERYLLCESGKADLGVTFLYKVAQKCHVDVADLLDGKGSKLSLYQLVRHGEGVEIERRKGFKYHHLGYLLKDRNAEPLYVVAAYNHGDQSKEMSYSTHEGFEFDYILKGSLKVDIEGHVEVLNEGDSIYYNSSKKHGMIAVNGHDCEFLAILMTKI